MISMTSTTGSSGIFSWYYAKDIDMLELYKTGVKIRISEEWGAELTVDFDKDDNIVGFNIIPALEFLKKSGFLAKDLSTLDSVSFEVLKKDSREQVVIHLCAGKKKIALQFAGRMLVALEA